MPKNNKASIQRREQKRNARAHRPAGAAPRAAAPNPLAGISAADLALARNALNNPKMADRIERAAASRGVSADQLDLVRSQLDSSPLAEGTDDVVGTKITVARTPVGILAVAALLLLAGAVCLVTVLGGLVGIILGAVLCVGAVISGLSANLLRHPERAFARLAAKRAGLSQEFHAPLKTGRSKTR